MFSAICNGAVTDALQKRDTIWHCNAKYQLASNRRPRCCLAHCRLMDALLQRQGAKPETRAAAVAAWLFNPFTATISTRGSGEALASCQLLGVLLALASGVTFSDVAILKTATLSLRMTRSAGSEQQLSLLDCCDDNGLRSAVIRLHFYLLPAVMANGHELRGCHACKVRYVPAYTVKPSRHAMRWRAQCLVLRCHWRNYSVFRLMNDQ